MENLLKQNKVYKFFFKDNEGEHILQCKLTEYGWSLHREIIYYDFSVVDSDSLKYRAGSRMILGLDFNNKDNEFNFYPYYNEKDSKYCVLVMNKKTYKSFIKLI
jgi:hypothetical protein